MLEAERSGVAAAARRLGADGLVLGTAGNVSARAGDLVAVTPTGAVLERLTAEDVVVVDLEGTLVAGGLSPTSELELHLGIYRRYGAGAVVHAHSPIATALACVVEELPAIHYQLLALGGPLRVAPYATFGSRELAELTLDALEGRTAALMANHGMIAFSPHLDGAMESARLVEWGAELYWRAAALGRPRLLSDGQLQAVVQAVTDRSYGSPQRVGQ
jgi:L-fuculose-phosphate aldolase